VNASLLKTQESESLPSGDASTQRSQVVEIQKLIDLSMKFSIPETPRWVGSSGN
jgi:hypothetical protein